MTSKIAIILMILSVFSSCRPGQQESIIKSAEQNAKNDSIRRNSAQKNELELKLALSDSVKRIEKEIVTARNNIGQAKTEYQVQLDKLGKIKKFKLLRKKDEREMQIRAQSDLLYRLETRISELEYQLVNLQVRLDYFNSEIQKNREY